MECLESVYRQDFDKPFEVIVVDSSPLNIGDKIRSVFPDVRFFHLKKRTLPGKARSKGAAEARGEIVFFTDTDCIVDRNWMKRLYEAHQKGYDVVGGSVINGTPESVFGTAEYLVEFNEINPWMKSQEVKALPSCNLSVKSHVFKEIGYFPDFMKGEDTIFCDNVVSHGGSIFFEPDASITHMNRTQGMHFIKNQISLGEGSNETRRRTKRHGYFLIQHPTLIPFIPIYRSLIVGKRLLTSNRFLFIRYVTLFPIIFIGLIAYTWGFIRGPYRSGLSTEKMVSNS
jgi:GT2 family glycosyltransferase